MSNYSPRHGGNSGSDRESEIVPEASSDQEQSDPLSVEGEAAGHQVNAGMEEEDAYDVLRISVPPAAPLHSPLPHLIPPSAQNPPPPPPPEPCYSALQRSFRALPHLTSSRSLGFVDDDDEFEIGIKVCSDQEQNNPRSVAGAGTPIRSHIVEIAGGMKEVISRRLKKVPDQAKMIYRVPCITRSSDEDAYAAQFVSFGPYKIGYGDLESANKHKWSFLQQILNMNKKVQLEKYLEEMDRVKQDVNGCYARARKMEIEMILLDGCCILGFLGILQQVEDQIKKQDKVVVKANTVDNEMRPTVDSTNASLLPSSRLPQGEVGAQTHQEKDKVESEASTVQKYLSGDNTMGEDALGQSSTVISVEVRLAVEEESKRTVDSTVIKLWHHDSIRHDLLLMENQLPFFVLQKIFDLATAGTPVQGSLILRDMVNQAIQKLLACYPLVATEQSFHHLLHCCHLMFKPAMANSSSSNSNPPAGLQPWRGATDLYKAGIKFKPKQCDPPESLLDVELVSGRTLMIPTLIIEDSTSSVFRNLIAFEQSWAHEHYFTAYAFFMGELMRTPGDVTLLVKKGVVENHIGADNEVSDFFNNLIKGVGFDVNGKHFLSSTLEELKSSYNSVGQRHFADLMQNYCRSPWLVISVVAAAIVLVCTVVQTVYAVIR